VWAPILSAVVVAVGGIWVAVINRRGQTDVSVAKSEAEFRNSLLTRVASLEGRVAEQEKALIKEREKNLDKQREYDALLIKYEALEREVVELRAKLEEYESKGKR
jgi:predicted  nucleic acid-binding Zn-ribbon protein